MVLATLRSTLGQGVELTDLARDLRTIEQVSEFTSHPSLTHQHDLIVRVWQHVVDKKGNGDKDTGKGKNKGQTNRPIGS